MMAKRIRSLADSLFKLIKNFVQKKAEGMKRGNIVSGWIRVATVNTQK